MPLTQIVLVPGQQVRTTQEYYEKHKRIVTGIIIEPKIDIGENMVIMRWISQEGEIDRGLMNQMVLMHKMYVEPA